MGIVRYIFARVLRVLIVVGGLIVVVFFLTRAFTDPVDVILGPDSSAAQRARLNAQLGFDQPLIEQFFTYVKGLMRGDLGESLSLDRPAIDANVERLPASLVLATCSVGLAVIVGLALGIAGGLKPGSIYDRLTIAVTSLSVAVPDFWLGRMFNSIFSVNLGWAQGAS